VLAYINISYIDNIIKALGAYMHKGTKEKLKYIREDVKLIFNNFTNNAKELLNVMRMLKVILSKSRPSNFFKLKYNLRAFDYNFYIKDNMHYIAMFITYIISISVH